MSLSFACTYLLDFGSVWETIFSRDCDSFFLGFDEKVLTLS
jgi:hypothetical protein